MTKYLITGTRKGFTENEVFRFLYEKVDPEKDEIIHGGAPGVDTFAENWCKHVRCNSTTFRPVRLDIGSYYLHRNAEMVALCKSVIAFWDKESRGTKFTMEYAAARNKEIILYEKSK